MPDPKSFEEALYTILAADADVAALVATRIFPDRATDAVTMPYIVYQLISGDRSQTQDSAISMTRQRFQIDCIADRADRARILANHVKDALHGFYGNLGSPAVLNIGFLNVGDGPSDFGEATKAYRRIVECEVLFVEPQ